MQNNHQSLLRIIKSCPKELDLTNEDHSDLLFGIVESLMDLGYDLRQIREIEADLIAQNDPSLIFIQLALKIVQSKMLVSAVGEPILISVIFAVYKEHNRIKKRIEHLHGEDFLLKKVRQLEWLFEGRANITWEIIVVDDGCPEKSGQIAQGIIDENHLNDKVRVLYLSDAIEQGYPTAKTIRSTADSQKGGSIVYGMWDAVNRGGVENHVLVFTDADLSTHLGQLMLLLDPLLSQNKMASIGSRREPGSVVIKKGARNDRGKLFIYLWKRLIPNLGEIVDTQCGFKAFRAVIVPEIIDNLIEKKFAFDIELLLRTELLKKGSIAKVPIAWIDSEEASTTTDLQPYLPMLKSIANMYRKYFTKEDCSEEFAAFIDSLRQEDFDRILNNIPQEIVLREPSSFADYDEVRVDDFKGMINDS